MACAALHFYENSTAELACVCVDSNRKPGNRAKLVQYAETLHAAGMSSCFVCPRRPSTFFVQKGGFRHGTVDDLPPSRASAKKKAAGAPGIDQEARCYGSGPGMTIHCAISFLPQIFPEPFYGTDGRLLSN